jgi:trehalose 6-phosphate synthase
MAMSLLHAVDSPGAQWRPKLEGRWDRAIVLANRAPVRFDRMPDGTISATRSGSGLVTALEPLVEACSGTWVAHAAGTADGSVGRDGRPHVPPANSANPAHQRYRLRHVWLSEPEHRGFYYGFANEALWPLCHAVHVRPVFRSSDYRMYRAANARFAETACEEAGSTTPLVLVQDYHFALAPRLLRTRMPFSTVVAFWHIPWPHPRVFGTCPWAHDLLDGLLGSDVAGFQTDDDSRNFLESVEGLEGAHVDHVRGVVRYRGHVTLVRAYPVGIPWPNPLVRSLPRPDLCRDRVARDLKLPHGIRLGVGVDRLDYTKGINEKFLAIERLLELNADLRDRLVFLQVAEPSRDCLPAYREARAQLLETRDRVNRRFGNERHRPILLLEAHHDAPDVYRFYRAADFCFVGSLHDGMNLVAKEFVCARDDERGVLVLSRFAGAARQLGAALIVNPYAVDTTAEALAAALTMPAQEQAARMRQMRKVVASSDTKWWTEQLLADAASASRESPLRAAAPAW